MSLSTRPVPERRRYPRHHFQAEIILFGNNKSFRTTTQNISLGGVFLSSRIPSDMVGEVLDVVIIAEKDGVSRRILLRGILVGVPGTTGSRMAFVNTPMLQFLKLQDLLRQIAAA